VTDSHTPKAAGHPGAETLTALPQCYPLGLVNQARDTAEESICFGSRDFYCWLVKIRTFAGPFQCRAVKR